MQHLAVAVGGHAGSVHADADGHLRLDFFVFIEEGDVHGLDLRDGTFDRIGNRIDDRVDLDFGELHLCAFGERAFRSVDRDGNAADDVAESGCRICHRRFFDASGEFLNDRNGLLLCSFFCRFGNLLRLFGFFRFFCGFCGFFSLFFGRSSLFSFFFRKDFFVRFGICSLFGLCDLFRILCGR